LKIGNSNEEGVKQLTLQCDEVLESWKALNGCATQNGFLK
jgi:hypothetical protein